MYHSTYWAIKMIKIDNEGNTRYYTHDGLLHRVNGPAIEWPDGRGVWYVNGDRKSVV